MILAGGGDASVLLLGRRLVPPPDPLDRLPDLPSRFLGALRKADLSEMPRGPMKFDDYGNPTMNVYVRKVERVNGRLQNTVIHTFPAVSQFWTYKPDEYLKAPPYTRDYPPCKHC